MDLCSSKKKKKKKQATKKELIGGLLEKFSGTVILLFSLQECLTVSFIIVIFWNTLVPLGLIVLIFFFFKLVSQSLATMRKTFGLTDLC